MIETRKRHCSFAHLNRAGRCIADCWMNREREFCSDCTGKNAQAFPTLDSKGAHEARISCGWIDGRDKEIIHDHEKGTYTVDYVYRPAINYNCNWGGKK